MFGRKKKQNKCQLPAEKPTLEATPGAMEETFSKVPIATITFTKERLPFLKNLLKRYYEAMEEQKIRFQHDTELRQLLRPLATEFGSFFEKGHKELRYLSDDEKVLHILAAYAGRLLEGLFDLKVKGWDGKGLQHDGYADDYRTDAMHRLRDLVNALEAGNDQATLSIPAHMAGQYQVWLIRSIEYAIREGKGPAADKEF